MRSLSILSLFCAHSVSQNQVKAPPFISLLFLFMSQCFYPSLIPSLCQLKQFKPRKRVQIYQYANRFNDRLLSSESFFKASEIPQEVRSVSLSDERHLLLLSRSSIDHSDGLFFHAFQVCKMSLVFQRKVDGFSPASCVFSTRLRSIDQSVKALSIAISHSGQDSGQDVHPHTHSNLPLELPDQCVQAVHQSRVSSK